MNQPASTSSYRTTEVPVRGGTLHTALWGPEDPAALTILAVHGVTASHKAWPALAEALPEVRIIAPDLRGRRRSNALPAPYGMPSHAEDLAAVLAALSTGPVVVVGHSMGAFVSVVLANLFPERVRPSCWSTAACRCRCRRNSLTSRLSPPCWGRRPSG